MNIYIDGIIYSLQKSGGITRYTNELVAGLANLGHKVVLLMHPNPQSRPPEHKNLEIIEFGSFLKGKSWVRKYIDYFFCKSQIKNYFKKHNIKDGVLHNTYLTYYKNLKIPQVMTIHDLTREKFPNSFNYIKYKFVLLLTKKSTIKSDAIICVSEQTKKDLSEYYKINTNKTRVIHLGVNPAFKIKNQVEKDSFRLLKNLPKPYFLYVGTRALYKNFTKFLEAYASWNKKDDFMLVAVGSGKFTSNELNFIEKLGIKNNIISFDFVSEEELVMFYNCAEAFVFPSLSEGFGLPLLEAMACGTIVLASDIPVFREIADNIPYYFNPNNTESILTILNDSLQRDQSRIDAGIELVKKFSWKNTINETLKVYDKLLKQKSNLQSCLKYL